MGHINERLTILSIAALASVYFFLGWSPTASANEICGADGRPFHQGWKEVRADRHEIRQDKKEIRWDRRELRHDRRDFRQDKRAGNFEAAKEHRREMRFDKKEYKADLKDLRHDRRDLRWDRRDRRHDWR